MHEYIIGKSGAGKTTFLQHHIINNAGGFAVLDPHGDLAEYIADTVDCIYLDPSDTEFPVGFDPLHHVPYDDRPVVAAQVVSSFKAVWADSWGPRMEYILINSLRLMLDNSQPIIAIPRLLTDRHFRSRLLRRCTDRFVKSFWEKEFDSWEDRFKREALSPVQNKIGQLVGNPVLRNILAHSTLNLADVMNTGKRLVVNLSKGKLGEEPSHLLGALLVSGFAHAAAGRASTPASRRRSFTLYVDEFQNFATESFASILSEARKFNLHLVLAHQFLGQVPDLLRQAVFGNAGRFVCFKIGSEDAPMISRELGLKNPEMLTDLAAFEAYQRHGLDAVRFRTSPPSPPNGKLAKVRAATRSRNARPRASVEERIDQLFQGG